MPDPFKGRDETPVMEVYKADAGIPFLHPGLQLYTRRNCYNHFAEPVNLGLRIAIQQENEYEQE